MKLVILHVRNPATRPVNERNAIASCDYRIGGVFVNMAGTTGGYEGYFGGNFLDFFILFIQNIGTIAGNIVGIQFFSRDMMLGD